VDELHRTHLHEMWRFAPRGPFSIARGLRSQRASVSSGENQPSGNYGKLFEADILQTTSSVYSPSADPSKKL
jgi:hypothetical protein